MKTQRGYTLIETLVAMLILVMLSASGLYGWQYWQQSQRLWQTASQARDYLLYLREDANWHNRDHSISVIREGTLWCLVSSVAGANTCHGSSPLVFFATRLERFLSAEREGVMSASLKNQQGFSLPEVMLAMVLMVMIVTALSGFQRTLMNSLASRNQYQQLWRHGWQQTQLRAISPPANWQVNRMQTSQAGCVSISVTLVSPGGREGEMTRLHCPNRQ